MGLTKLDIYDYTLLPGVIRIDLNGTNDPILVDIMSEIEQNGGRIYVEGFYYEYLNNYRIRGHGRDSYIELDVLQIALT